MAGSPLKGNSARAPASQTASSCSGQRRGAERSSQAIARPLGNQRVATVEDAWRVKRMHRTELIRNSSASAVASRSREVFRDRVKVIAYPDKLPGWPKRAGETVPRKRGVSPLIRHKKREHRQVFPLV